MSLATSSEDRKRFSFLSVLVALAIILGVIMLAVVFGDLQAHYDLLGLESDQKSDFLKYLGFAMGGVLVAIQATASHLRAKAMEAVVKQQAEANRQNESGLRQERLKNAIEHLGSDSESVRLGGAYELFHLAEDTESLRQTVLDILCAHIRRTTGQDHYKETYSSRPSTEIESLLAQLFVYEPEVFSGHRVNLSESWLNGAELRGALLGGADLRSAQLSKARLEYARLERANLAGARLNEADLGHACLREASLELAFMRGAQLGYAELQGAIIVGGHLAGASLQGSSLQGADLTSAELCGVDLVSANLEGAKLSWARLQAASLGYANLRGAGNAEWGWQSTYAERIRASIGKEGTLSDVQTGGLEKDRVDEIVDQIEGILNRGGLEIRLRPYVGKPDRRGLPKGHGAILGSYGQVEAARWIAQHDSAMEARAEGTSSTPDS